MPTACYKAWLDGNSRNWTTPSPRRRKRHRTTISPRGVNATSRVDGESPAQCDSPRLDPLSSLSRFRKFGQRDKWKGCSPTAIKMAEMRSNDDATCTPEPHIDL